MSDSSILRNVFSAREYISNSGCSSSDGEGKCDIFSITSFWVTPEIDLFATRKNRQVKRFFSLNPEDHPLAVAALSQTWHWNLAYALLLPLCLISRILKKVRKDRARIILIAPFLSRWAGFALRRSLSESDPWVLPNRRDLLHQGSICQIPK